jgi:hypothetical protein
LLFLGLLVSNEYHSHQVFVINSNRAFLAVCWFVFVLLIIDN